MKLIQSGILVVESYTRVAWYWTPLNILGPECRDIVQTWLNKTTCSSHIVFSSVFQYSMLSLLSLTPLLLSPLYMRNGGENYFELICWCIPIPCLCFYILSVHFVVCSIDLCLTIKHYYCYYYKRNHHVPSSRVEWCCSWHRILLLRPNIIE